MSVERPKIATTLLPGLGYGWGVCSANLISALAQRAEVMTVPHPCPEPVNCPEPLLQIIQDPLFAPFIPQARSQTRNVGYTFREENLVMQRHIANATRFYDHVVAGSSWLSRVLREVGLHATSAIPQGVDHEIFKPGLKSHFADRFVVFSGGKWEFRKGQDVVLKAFSIFARKRRDALLLGHWANPYAFSSATMEASNLISYQHDPDLARAIGRAILQAGVREEQCTFSVAHPMPQNILRRDFYLASDVGLFPNRCEGGTNLVLMEYQACGRPAIGLFAHGHEDVLDREGPLSLRRHSPLCLLNNQHVALAEWFEPDVDEVVAKLVWAYENRGRLGALGETAWERMQPFTWERAADQFLKTLVLSP